MYVRIYIFVDLPTQLPSLSVTYPVIQVVQRPLASHIKHREGQTRTGYSERQHGLL